MNSHTRMGSPPSPKISPRSLGSGSEKSGRSSSNSTGLMRPSIRTTPTKSNNVLKAPKHATPLMRQGTFTKEEGTFIVNNVPIVDIDIGETSSTTSTYSTNTNTSLTRLSNIPVAGPIKHISPGKQTPARKNILFHQYLEGANKTITSNYSHFHLQPLAPPATYTSSHLHLHLVHLDLSAVKAV